MKKQISATVCQSAEPRFEPQSGSQRIKRDLDYREAQVLKLLLKRVIETSAADLPDAWRKENIRREDSILNKPATDSSSTGRKP